MTLPARPNVLGGLRNTLGRWLQAAGANESELFDITLSASEAATNAIEHAYGAREASFTVRCEHDGQDVKVTVRDARPLAHRPPAGRRTGLEIMRSLVDSVKIDSDEGGTVVDNHQETLPPAMSALDIERIDGVPIAHVNEDIDAANAATTQQQLADALGPDASSLIVDLSDTRYLDSAGIDMLLRLGDRLDHRRAKLILVIPDTSQLMRLATIVGLPDAIAVHPTLLAALQQATNP